ncbi:hypothetical protein BLA39750_02224 [Burkholderia lata]|uniref:Uncharacterized protein n=1 Tax=Burkholderia lata (strain ATCC 17760 / DSM 23089 / LMG 22485 / NCIMB 9086 / R18194 / 383) TaxID=482957 RepID=A0A6P2WJ25_BURL3|nr:hypothetical protein [Burkholderia lata]VWC95972.1 hypothetical protein BLA39750_02224 [Burkholderia lata]
MTDAEIRLRCHELAFERARAEQPENFLDRVAEIATWLYDRIVIVPEGSNAGQKGRGKTDKSPEIFK